MNKECELCKFKLANIRGDGKYRCANQDGQRFGQEAEGGCPQYDRFNPKPDMNFKDALEILLMLFYTFHLWTISRCTSGETRTWSALMSF